MSAPVIVSLTPGSPAARSGLAVGDEVLAVDGQVPRDVLEYRWLVDDEGPVFTIRRDGDLVEVTVDKEAGTAVGAEVHAPVFDAVTTCDNHCEFCFIHQLPAGMRPSLSVKDDDYRLSFLYGNFTTLTRFTEADLERVMDEGLSPLYVSIHATDPLIRSRMLRNNRGATSLRWLRVLLDHGVEVHGQVVVCPGRNDGDVLDDTCAGILDEYPDLASVCVVPLGVSRFNRVGAMRAHTPGEAARVLDQVHRWQETFRLATGRRVVHAADEYYLLADRPFPDATHYEGFPMHEDGVGMATAFAGSFSGVLAGTEGDHSTATSASPHEGRLAASRAGFFAWVDGAGGHGYRARTHLATETSVHLGGASSATSDAPPVAILTGRYGARVLEPLLAAHGYGQVEIVAVPSDFFGGNIGVTGLLTGQDLAATLATRPEGWRHLLPDVCLSEGRFLDGLTPDDLPRPVEIVPTDGAALRRHLDRPGVR